MPRTGCPRQPDAEPPCNHTKSAIIVFGRYDGRTLTVCPEPDCPVHNPHVATHRAAEAQPTITPALEQATKEQAAQRIAEYAQRMAEYHVEQERKEEERKAEFERLDRLPQRGSRSRARTCLRGPGERPVAAFVFSLRSRTLRSTLCLRAKSSACEHCSSKQSH